MKDLIPKYRTYLQGLVCIVMLSAILSESGLGQTAGGTQVSAQATGTYSYKKRPFAISSSVVTFTVASLPNFEMHYTVKDSNVIFNDVVQLWLEFKNVGNAAADTVTIQSVVPPTAVSIVSTSDGGTISGNTVTWKKLNYASAKQDSFLLQLRIDTTTRAQTVLSTGASLAWQGKSLTAGQNLVVGNFARLTLTNTINVPFVGSGRQIDYQVQVANTGNVQSDSTILVDTISANGVFDHADLAPTSVTSGGHIVTWNLGTLQPSVGQQKITVSVQTSPNLGIAQITNAASVRSSKVPLVSSNVLTTSIMPVRPAALKVTTAQQYIFGAANQDSTQITATVSDSLGNPIPDGVPVSLTTTLGLFRNQANTFNVLTSGGKAQAFLIATNISNNIASATVTAVAGVVQSGTISGAVNVTMYPGAVTGIVRTLVQTSQGVQPFPYLGALAKVFDSGQNLVGSDTTKSNGVFFIPLNKQLKMMFSLVIIVVDEFGDTSSTSSGVSSDTLFGRKAVKIMNTISGRLQYSNGNTPIPIKGVDVFLDSLSAFKAPRTSRAPRASTPALRSRIRTATTDDLGRYKFQGLEPAVYEVTVDSAKFPNYAGGTTIYDTLTGTFLINLNILVKPNAAASMTLSAVPTVFGGDTIKYYMKFENQGNIFHTKVAMTDTLPHYTSMVVGRQGLFKSMTYDSSGVMRWAMDTMAVGTKDSVWLTLAVSRNIPDSTYIHNRSWFSTGQIAPQSSDAVTLVRSAPLMTLKNFVIQTQDTVVAGDSVKFQIWYRNAGTDSLRNVQIVDSIFNAGRSIIRYKHISGNVRTNDTTVVDSSVVWKIGSIPPGTVDSLTLYIRTDYSLQSGKRILTTASLVQNGKTVASSSASVYLRSNPQFSTLLTVTKTADKNVAEIGDVVTYQVAVTNTSTFLMKDLRIIDLLPHSFKYYANSARYIYGNRTVAPETQKSPNGEMLTWTLSSKGRDTLRAGTTGLLIYQLVLGADALESQGLNTVYANANDTVGNPFVSLPAYKQVTVQPGVFTDRGVIIGKVFYDDDRNAYQSEGETGLKGVELWMEDGTRIITGDDGKFSLPDVRPGQHVLRVNERSLPPKTELLKGNRDFAGDATSRFVRLPEGGIARANFFVKRLLGDSVRQRVGKVSKTAAMRSASPEQLYLRDNPSGVAKTNTVEFTVHVNYSGGTWLQRIQVFDELPAGFTYADGSGTFNGRPVVPTIEGEHLTWRLGRGAALFEGTLRYRVDVKRPETQLSGLESRSLVNLMTADSVVIDTDTLRTLTSFQKISYSERTFPIQALVFNPGKSTLRKDALNVFQPIIDLVKQYRYADLMIVGYPDIPVKAGSTIAALQNLAMARAAVALDFLSRRMKLDSIHIVACGVFTRDTSKNLMASMMAQGTKTKIAPHHLELRVQDYFVNALVGRDTSTSQSAISLVRTVPESEKEFTDSLTAVPGDDLLFSYQLFTNPASSVLAASIIDSTAGRFVISNESLTLNRVPIVSAAQFNGVLSSTVTPLLKKGSNEMQLQAMVPPTPENPRIEHVFYYEHTNGFGETSIQKSNTVLITVKGVNLSLIEIAVRRERELAGTENTPKATTAK